MSTYTEMSYDQLEALARMTQSSSLELWLREQVDPSMETFREALRLRAARRVEKKVARKATAGINK